jgi:predicted Zn-dependent peptidase
MFRSPEDIVENYSMNEYFKRPADHYKTYPGKINALTIKDIMNAADKYLVPTAFTYTIVGDTTVILRNDTVSGFLLRKLKPSLFIEQDSLPLLP